MSSDLSQEDMQAVASFVGQVNSEAQRINQSIKAVDGGSGDHVMHGVDGNKIMGELMQGSPVMDMNGLPQTPQQPYTPTNDDGFGDDIPLPEANTQPYIPPTNYPTPQPPHSNVPTKQTVDLGLPPTILTALLRKITSIEITNNKILEIVKGIVDNKKDD